MPGKILTVLIPDKGRRRRRSLHRCEKQVLVGGGGAGGGRQFAGSQGSFPSVMDRTGSFMQNVLSKYTDRDTRAPSSRDVLRVQRGGWTEQAD